MPPLVLLLLCCLALPLSGADEAITVRLHWQGKVQGVNFRGAMRTAALDAGLTGYIYNDPGGDVIAVVSGSRDGIGRFLAASFRGSSAAEVARLEAAVAPQATPFRRFNIYDAPPDEAEIRRRDGP